MKKLTILSLIAAFAFLLAPQQATAQTEIEVGPRIGIDVGDASDIGGDFFIGAEGRITPENFPVAINPSLDYYFVDVDGYSLFAFDINALYEFGIDNEAFTPYAGGGLGFIRSSYETDLGFGAGTVSGSNTEIGLNLIGGAEFEMEGFKPFVQAKINVGGDFTLFNLMGGVLFSL